METKSKWTIEELKKYQWANLFKLHKGYVCFVFIFMLLLLTVAVNALARGYIFLGTESLLFAFILPLAIYLITIFKVRKNYSSSKLLQTTVVTFKFDDDHFETNSDKGSVAIKYDDLYKILETKTNFYLFTSDCLAVNVIKENCSAELIAFLHEKAN